MSEATSVIAVTENHPERRNVIAVISWSWPPFEPGPAMAAGTS